MTTQQIVINNGSLNQNATNTSDPIMLVSTKSPVGMNEADEKCYENRYSDV